MVWELAGIGDDNSLADEGIIFIKLTNFAMLGCRVMVLIVLSHGTHLKRRDVVTL